MEFAEKVEQIIGIVVYWVVEFENIIKFLIRSRLAAKSESLMDPFELLMKLNRGSEYGFLGSPISSATPIEALQSKVDSFKWTKLIHFRKSNEVSEYDFFVLLSS